MVKLLYLLPFISLVAVSAHPFNFLNVQTSQRRDNAPFGEVKRIEKGGNLTQVSTWDSRSTIDKVCNDNDKAPATLDQGCVATFNTIKITCANGGKFQIDCDEGCNPSDNTKCDGTFRDAEAQAGIH